MKVNIEKNIVEFIPENAEEQAKVEQIWRILIDCVGTSRKLTPVGEYVPSKGDKSAMFYIEGLGTNPQTYTEIHVSSDCTCYCENCNKQLNLKKGDIIPICCGKIMELID